MSDLKEPRTVILTATKANKKPFTIQPLAIQQQPTHSPEVQDAGDLAASQGVAAYSAWLGSLTPDVKATIKHMHANWTAKAKAVVVEDVVI